MKSQPEVTAKTDDLSNVDAIAAIIQGADVVVSAYQPPADNTDAIVDVTKRQVEAVKKAGKSRLIVVGGAGQLEVAPGVTLINRDTSRQSTCRLRSHMRMRRRC